MAVVLCTVLPSESHRPAMHMIVAAVRRTSNTGSHRRGITIRAAKDRDSTVTQADTVSATELHAATR